VLRAAAVLAVALLAGWNLLLQDQLDRARAYEQRVAAVLDVAAQEGSITAILTPGSGAGASGLAAVGADGAVTIAMRELAATQGDQVYEAWVIDGDASPVPLGAFRVGGDGTGFLESAGVPARAGIVLAVTLEPRPGATAPSSDPVSLGTATASG
jgi:anti-sigma-K factor RskA